MAFESISIPTGTVREDAGMLETVFSTESLIALADLLSTFRSIFWSAIFASCASRYVVSRSTSYRSVLP